MELKWNTEHVDLEGVVNIARGNEEKVLKYLNQFEELVPERMVLLDEHLKLDDRQALYQILHKMSPQLQFFGVSGIIDLIRKIEYNRYEMPKSELDDLVDIIKEKVNTAHQEVRNILHTHFE